jgi:hypothetical protein
LRVNVRPPRRARIYATTPIDHRQFTRRTFDNYELTISPSQGKLVLILPISGRKLKSITVGIHYMVAASRFETSRNAAVVAWFMLKPAPG